MLCDCGQGFRMVGPDSEHPFSGGTEGRQFVMCEMGHFSSIHKYVKRVPDPIKYWVPGGAVIGTMTTTGHTIISSDSTLMTIPYKHIITGGWNGTP
jgi:hypothetical protein